MSNIVTAATVRAWSVKAGLREATAKNIGRLTLAEVDAFNAKHKTKTYAPGVKPAKTIAVVVPTKNARGANITKTVRVDAAELRKATGSEGKRGRVDTAKAVEYVIGAGLV